VYSSNTIAGSNPVLSAKINTVLWAVFILYGIEKDTIYSVVINKQTAIRGENIAMVLVVKKTYKNY
jgi:Holliday junction resolvase